MNYYDPLCAGRLTLARQLQQQESAGSCVSEVMERSWSRSLSQRNLNSLSSPDTRRGARRVSTGEQQYSVNEVAFACKIIPHITIGKKGGSIAETVMAGF